MERIYLSPPHLEGRERELLIEAYESNWITTLGPRWMPSSRRFCEKIGINPQSLTCLREKESRGVVN